MDETKKNNGMVRHDSCGYESKVKQEESNTKKMNSGNFKKDDFVILQTSKPTKQPSHRETAKLSQHRSKKYRYKCRKQHYSGN